MKRKKRDEKPVHRVSVGKFAMGVYEVTFAEYDKFAEADGRRKPDDWGWGRGNRPVINVSWHDANDIYDFSRVIYIRAFIVRSFILAKIQSL